MRSLLLVLFVFYAASSIADEKITLNPKLITASRVYSNQVPGNIADGNPNTVWNSGKFPTAWIRIDLGESKPISRILLNPEQTPSGNTSHVIGIIESYGDENDAPEYTTQVSKFTSSGVKIEIPIHTRGRYIEIVTTKSPSWVAWRDIEVYEERNVKQYFGYYCSACSWVGSGNYLTVTSNHSNLAHMTVGDAALPSKLFEAQTLGMKVLLDVSELFFNDAVLLPDYQSRWAQFNTIYPDLSNVVAFYMADESNRRGFSRASLKVAIDQIKINRPEIPVASIFSGTEGNLNNVDLFDWVGLDCYDDGEGSCAMFTYAGRIASLRARLDVSRQRLMLVPQAGIDVRRVSSSRVNSKLPLQADMYLSYAKNDPLVVTVIPFIWQTFDDGTNSWYGAEVFPTLRDKFTAFGLQVTKK